MPQTRDQVFDRVKTDYLLRGASRVSWQLRPRFTDPQPHVFQLQVNRSAGDPSEWEDVGASVEDEFFALDDTPRLAGQDRGLLYRVVLTTPVSTYNSPLADILGQLQKRQWLQAREIIRRFGLQQRGLRRYDGFLLKRKTSGVPCTCLNPITGGIRDSRHAPCHGTGWIEGYWRGVPNTMRDLSPASNYPNNRGMGATTDIQRVRKAVFLGFPVPDTRDVWVDATADRRYFIQDVKVVSEMNLVPLVIQATLREAEHSDPIYEVAVG